MFRNKDTNRLYVSERQRVGLKTGIIGIIVNGLLFSIKLTLGLINNSISALRTGSII